MSQTQPKIGKINIGDQIAYWVYDKNFKKKYLCGTVMSIDQHKFYSATFRYFQVAENPAAKIYRHQIEKVINKSSSTAAG